MQDSGVPGGMAGRFAELERRLKALEVQQRARSSGVQGGSLRVLDENGVEVARAGRMPEGQDGLSVSSNGPIPYLRVDDQLGVALPWMVHPFRDPSLSKLVTLGTFAPVWEAYVELITGLQALFRTLVYADVGTTLELRFVIASVVVGGVKSVSGVTQYVEWRRAHGALLHTGPVAFSLEARRSAGAGNCGVYSPAELAIGSVGNLQVNGWVP